MAIRGRVDTADIQGRLLRLDTVARADGVESLLQADILAGVVRQEHLEFRGSLERVDVLDLVCLERVENLGPADSVETMGCLVPAVSLEQVENREPVEPVVSLD